MNCKSQTLSILCASVLLFCSCNKTNKEYVANQIELGEVVEDNQNLSDLFEVVQLIPLENKEECMLRYLSKFQSTPNGFLILGKVNTNESLPLLFDKEGKLITKVGDLGHGKGEYQSIWDVTASESGDTIVVSVFDGLMRYDSQGKFIDSKQIFDYAQIHSIISYQGGYICSTDYSEPGHIIHFLDNDLNITDELLPINCESVDYPFFMPYSLTVCNGKLYYYDGFRTMFSIIDLKDRSIINQTILHGDNTATLEKTISNKNKENDGLYDGALSYYLYNNHIRGNFFINNDISYYDLDLDKNAIKLFKQFEYLPAINDYDGKYYYSVITADALLNMLDGHYLTTQKTKDMFKQAYERLSQEVNKLDNYIIVKLRKIK